jgi:hypothetical protein
MVPQQAAAGDRLLRAQIVAELRPPDAALMSDQWPALLIAAVVGLVLLLRPPRRTTPALVVAAFAAAFLVAGHRRCSGWRGRRWSPSSSCSRPPAPSP